MAGEAGLEAVLPLTRVNGKLGVASSQGAGYVPTVNITVNAEAGTDEQAIYDAINSMTDQIRNQVVDVVLSMARGHQL